MTSWFVTRHPGAAEWFNRRNIKIDEVREHLNPEEMHPRDVVYGVLPLAIVEQLCKKGVAFYSMSVLVPESLRGKELTADMLDEYGCKLIRYDVKIIEEIN